MRGNTPPNTVVKEFCNAEIHTQKKHLSILNKLETNLKKGTAFSLMLPTSKALKERA
jgi:hypothetical protein